MRINDLIMQEGNRREFTYRDYKCLIRRNSSLLILCGYVKLKESLPESVINSLVVHGGITYDSGDTIGFDCGHCGDYVPVAPGPEPESEYRNMEYVERQLKLLVDQIIEYQEGKK